MSESEPDRLLEIYKLHADLADRVSQRREGANRLYVSLNVGLVIFLAALLRFGSGDVPKQLVLGAVGGFGALLSVSWFVVIGSYRQLNARKYCVLQELEKRLPHQFFSLEDKKSSRYWKLTYVEVTLPLIFFALFLALMAYSIVS